MLLCTVLVFVAAVVGMFAFAAATTAVCFGRRALRKELLPAMLAAKVKGFPVALGGQRRRLVHRHAANRVFGHGFAVCWLMLAKFQYRHFTEANARVSKPLHSILQYSQFVVASEWLYPIVLQRLEFSREADGRIFAEEPAHIRGVCTEARGRRAFGGRRGAGKSREGAVLGEAAEKGLFAGVQTGKW